MNKKKNKILIPITPLYCDNINSSRHRRFSIETKGEKLYAYVVLKFTHERYNFPPQVWIYTIRYANRYDKIKKLECTCQFYVLMINRSRLPCNKEKKNTKRIKRDQQPS